MTSKHKLQIPKWMLKKQPQQTPPEPPPAQVSLLCVQDTRIGGVHYTEGDSVTVQEHEVAALVATGCFQRVAPEPEKQPEPEKTPDATPKAS